MWPGHRSLEKLIKTVVKLDKLEKSETPDREGWDILSWLKCQVDPIAGSPRKRLQVTQITAHFEAILIWKFAVRLRILQGWQTALHDVLQPVWQNI